MNQETRRPQGSSIRLRGQPITYFPEPGFPGGDRISPATNLLAEYCELPTQGTALVLGIGEGVLAAVLAKAYPGCEIWLLDDSYLALKMSTLTLQANQVENARPHDGISVLPGRAGKFDTAIMKLPKGRKLAQRWLVEAFYALGPSGILYLSGANNLGVRTAIKDAETLFGPGSTLGHKKGNRIVRFVKASHHKPEVAWFSEPGISPGTWNRIQAETPQGTFQLQTLPGIFSYDRLDVGTRFLLDHMHITSGERALDLGCGYGIIGLAAAAAGAGRIHLVDVSNLAVAAARVNLENHSLDSALVLPSDALSAVGDKHFDVIYSNPPFHSGREVNYQITENFIRGSWEVLETGGRLVLVANQFIRYDRPLNEIYHRVECLAEDERYKVWQAVK